MAQMFTGLDPFRATLVEDARHVCSQTHSIRTLVAGDKYGLRAHFSLPLAFADFSWAAWEYSQAFVACSIACLECS